MSERKDNVIPPVAPLVTNYEAIDKLTAGLIKYVQAAGIKHPDLDAVIALIGQADAAGKIAFVRLHVAPKIDGLQVQIAQKAVEHKISITPEQIDKCHRYFMAMVEVATQ